MRPGGIRQRGIPLGVSRRGVSRLGADGHDEGAQRDADEKTGNLWRAQGRRLRLDLKNFLRHTTLTTDEPEGWRGEIRDGEVVRTHEEALEDEENENPDEEEEEEDEEEGEYADQDDGAETDEEEDEYADEDEDDGEYADEDEEAEYAGEDEPEGEPDEEEDEDEEYEPSPPRRRRRSRSA